MNKTYWKIGFDLKSKYQKNLLLSICIVNGLIIIAIMTSVLFLSSNSIDSMNIYSNEHTSFSSGNNAQSDNEKTNNEISYAMFLPADFPSGYIGKVKIVRDFKRPEINFNKQNTINSKNYNISISDVSANLISYGSGSGDYNGYGDDDFGLPNDKPYLPQVKNDWDIIGNEYNVDILFNRPAFARLASPRWPSDAKKNDTGIVEILFTIYKNGYISLWNDIEIIKEFPKGKGFGLMVKSAIYYRSKFESAIKNGEPVDTKIMLAVTVCRSCEFYVVAQNDVVIASAIR